MEKKRVAWIDFVRAFAIISVVICHAVETDYYFIRTGSLEATRFHWYYENILFTIGRLGVPLFLMITGALMLGREYDIKKFYKSTLLPLFFTTEIWIVFNYFYYMIYNSLEFDIKNFVGNLLFLKQSPLNHMWYMPMILGIYLVIPFVAKAIKGIKFSDVLLPLTVGFIAFLLMPLYNAFAGYVIPQLPGADFIFNVGYLGGLYGIIMVLGHYVVNVNIFKRVSTWVVVSVLTVSFALNVIFARFFFVKQLFHTDVFGSYKSLFIIIVAVCLFELFRRFPIERCNKVITLISKGSFAIYLTHNIVLITANALLEKLPVFVEMGVILQTITRFAIAFIVPVLLVWVVDKLPLPRVKKILLFIK